MNMLNFSIHVNHPTNLAIRNHYILEQPINLKFKRPNFCLLFQCRLPSRLLTRTHTFQPVLYVSTLFSLYCIYPYFALFSLSSMYPYFTKFSGLIKLQPVLYLSIFCTFQPVQYVSIFYQILRTNKTYFYFVNFKL